MVIMGIVFILGLIFFCFYYSKKEEMRKEQYAVNFAVFGFCCLSLGAMISYGLGTFVLPSHYVLKEVNVLESAEISGEERFLLKERNNWGVVYYTFFIKKGNEIVEKQIADAEKNITYEKGTRVEKIFKKELKNKNLDWFFFCSEEYSDVVISDEGDIYDNQRVLLIDL